MTGGDQLCETPAHVARLWHRNSDRTMPQEGGNFCALRQFPKIAVKSQTHTVLAHCPLQNLAISDTWSIQTNPDNGMSGDAKRLYRRAGKILVGEKIHLTLHLGTSFPSSVCRARRQGTPICHRS